MNNAGQVISGPGEISRLTCAGGGYSIFAGVVKRNYANNVYMVRTVDISAEGQTPVEIGREMKATNLAEDFAQQGQLPAGKHVMVCSTGGRNIFHAAL
jgi:hypothetical protein